MSGVGSTNAMKKGSANNPFLAFSEADMKGYLNSAYTGCIVKYTGDPIARKITFETANIPEHAQNLVFTRNAPTFGDYGFGDLVITKKQNGSTTTEYLRCACCNLLTGLIGPLSSGTPSGDNYVKFIGLFSSNINTSNSNLIRACWVPDAIDSKYEYPDWWPVTPGWQEDFVNTEGKVVEWGYGEDVVFTYSGDSDAVLLVPCVITPYEVGELYKVVYIDNEYRYEEFHCISEDKTTAGVEDVAPGKTFYDFTGTKQVGTGTRANPFLARSDSDMNAFNNATYLGKFVKYIGKTNNTYVKDAIYQVTNDATEYDRYMLLPTLENEAQPSELAEGKELISSLGAVVVGTGNIVLKAATTEGMQALFTEANVGKLVQYLGDSNVYIKDAIYQIVDTSAAKQYYELPALTSEGTADDLALGKELINSKGEKVTGKRPGKLNDTSWANIRSIILSGKASDYWRVGDTKTITSKSGNKYTIRLCDLQDGRYDYSDGSGKSKAVFEFVELYILNGTMTWKMNSTGTNAGGWAQSEIKTSIMPAILADLPDDVVEIMSEVNVLSGVGGTTANTSLSNNKLFLAAEMELFLYDNYSIGTVECPLGQFDYYKTNDTPLLKRKSYPGQSTSDAWWERSPAKNREASCCYVDSDGTSDYGGANYGKAISPIFTI